MKIDTHVTFENDHCYGTLLTSRDDARTLAAFLKQHFKLTARDVPLGGVLDPETMRPPVEPPKPRPPTPPMGQKEWA
jgi:hypothetical protein